MIFDPLSLVLDLPPADLVLVEGTDRDTGEHYSEMVPVAAISEPVLPSTPRDDG